jgi:hypothetical protein
MAYDLDPTGKSLRNKIINESKSISLGAGLSHLFIIPIDGPYFAESLFVKYTPTVGEPRVLLPDVDYYPVFPYAEATRKINAPIFAGIEFIDVTLNGSVTYAYQTMGGVYSSDIATINALEAGFTGDPQFTAWETLVTLPAVPVITHPWTVANVDDIANTVSELEKVGLVVHLRPKFLPEPGQEVFIPTADEIGLGNVPNYPAATQQEALDGVETQALMTPATTKAAVTAEVTRVLSDSGYLIPIPYAGSLYITNPKTTVDYLGDVYAIKPNAVPYTTTGVWATDKSYFAMVRGSEIENWVRTQITVAGNESEISGLGKVFTIAVEHDSAILPQLVVNDVNFLVYGVDYKMSDDTLYVSYPLEADDKLTLHTKRSIVNWNRESQINKVFVATTGNNVFDITDKNVNVQNIRVTINDFVILDPLAGDYTVSNGILTINYVIGVGDIIEVENVDSMPMFGKALLRNLVNGE